MSLKDKIETITREIPGRYLRIGGVQGTAYLYLLSECCIPVNGKPDNERVLPINDFEKIPGFIDELKPVIAELFGDDPDTDSLAERILKLREELKEFATDIYAYKDIICLHEYVLKRVKPVDSVPVPALNDEAEARELLSAIFKAQSNSVINENIVAAVSRLPLRMTKARYHDILMNELKAYSDSSADAFERNMFLMRMSAGIADRPSGTVEAPEAFIRDFTQLDLKNLDSATKMSFEERLEKCKELLDDYRDVLELIVQTADYFLVYMKNYKDSSPEAIAQVRALKPVVDESLDNLERGVREDMSDRVHDLFASTEGTADEEFENIAKSLGHFLKSSEAKTDLELKPYFDRFLLCDRLLSQSYYADIENDDEEDTRITGAKAIEEAVDLFCEDLFALSANETKMMTRARMAAAFSYIPVFFNSRTEVMNYVLESIGGCRDNYEKSVSLKAARDAIA